GRTSESGMIGSPAAAAPAAPTSDKATARNAQRGGDTGASIGNMARRGAAPRAIEWDGAALRALDQTLAPWEDQWGQLRGAADTAAAIRRLAIRGAPLIGIAAGYGLAMEVARDARRLEAAARELASARPT